MGEGAEITRGPLASLKAQDVSPSLLDIAGNAECCGGAGNEGRKGGEESG